jgi:hypothetical protein
VVEDIPLLDYLFRQRVPMDPVEADRVRTLALRYRARGDELETLVNPAGLEVLQRWVPVPPVCMRTQIIRDAHELLGHAGRDKIAEALMTRWWWRGLRVDVMRELQLCTVCQPERLGAEVWGPVLDVDRPARPFMGWSVDLMGPMPEDASGARYLAVAVDVFSKWVEAAPLTDKRAFTTCEWLYDQILARWGRPAFIRLDNGGEWAAEFG